MKGEQIKALYKEMGLNQKQFAEKSGIHYKQIQKIERGEIQIPNMSLKNAVALAQALDITAEQLLNN